jgi:hypothetical protein
MADRLLGTMRKELKDDPVGWADRVGLVKVQPIDFASPEAPQMLSARVTQADAVAKRYGVEPKYLRENEKAALSSALDQGGEPMLNAVGIIAASAGPRSVDILGEVSKNSPTAAIVGGLVAEAGSISQAAKDAAVGLELRKQPSFERVAPSPKAARAEATSVLNGALSRFPETESAFIDAANAIYEARARKQQITEFNADLWKQGLRELSGERTVGGRVYGGIVDTDDGWSARSIILPPFLAQDSWRQAIDAVSAKDLEAAGLGIPAGRGGVPVPLNKMKNAALVQVGDGRYAMALGDPDTPGAEQWIVRQDNPEQRFELDFRALRPRLELRRPDLFAGNTYDMINPETRALKKVPLDYMLSGEPVE